MLINHDQLHTLIAIVELESFSSAAKRLRVSAPAVSQQMKALSETLGVALFERVGRRAVPTAEAREVVERIREPLEALSVALATAGRSERRVAGEVRIGGPQPFCRWWLRPRLLRLVRAFPDLCPTVSYGVASVLGDRLRGGEIDFALLAAPVDAQDLVVKPVHTETFVGVAARAYLKQRPTPDRFIVFDSDHAMLAPWWRVHHPRRAFDGHVAARIASLDEMLALAMAGIGIAVLPDYFVADAIKQGVVVQVDPSGALPKNVISIAWRVRAAHTGRFVATLGELSP